MLIGIPKEIKNNEFRVGLTAAGVRELVASGHQVMVETAAGCGIGMDDECYRAAGAEIVDTPEALFERAGMIIKVKEPQPNECRMLDEGQLLFTYLHLAPDPTQTELLLASGVTAIAYETVTDARGGLPLLTPMSEVAGRMSIQAGAQCLEKSQGGAGRLLGGVPGVHPAEVVVVGGGVVGTNSIRMAMGLEARVTVLDRSLERLAELDLQFGGRLNTIFSNRETLEQYVLDADLVVGAVLIPGAAAPKLVSRKMVAGMRSGSVLVDVAIDQGGCFETSHATTHAEPTYIVDDVVHYCVANMPGAVPHTSTYALTNATLPYALALANNGLQAMQNDPGLLNGLNVHQGKVTHEAVAQALNYEYVPAEQALSV